MVRPLARLRALGRTVATALTQPRWHGFLGGMDDRMLRDIGLSRHDVWTMTAEPLLRDVATGSAWRAGGREPAVRAGAARQRARARLIRLWAEEGRLS